MEIIIRDAIIDGYDLVVDGYTIAYFENYKEAREANVVSIMEKMLADRTRQRGRVESNITGLIEETANIRTIINAHALLQDRNQDMIDLSEITHRLELLETYKRHDQEYLAFLEGDIARLVATIENLPTTA